MTRTDVANDYSFFDCRFFIAAICASLAAAFFFYFTFLLTVKESSIRFDKKSVSGQARVVVYKGQPQLSIIEPNGEMVRVNCYIFDSSNICLNPVLNNNVDGNSIKVSYLKPVNLPFSNYIILELIADGSVVVSCTNSADRIGIDKSYCVKTR